MDSELARADDLIELLHPDLTAVILFAGAARQEATIVDSEDKCVEKLLVTQVEWDVYEHRLR